MESVLDNERRCYVCHTEQSLHKHHVFPGNGRRQVSEREGCWVYLCAEHHNMSPRSVHMNKAIDLELRKECQRAWQERNDRDFLEVFGVNYL